MNAPIISDPALRLVELIQSSAVLRPVVEDRPDLHALFIRAAEVAGKMSSDRSRLIESVTRAADASDRVVEAIREGNVADLAERLVVAARAIDELGDAFKDFRPIAAVAISVANSAAN
jgi:hypothetical protein